MVAPDAWGALLRRLGFVAWSLWQTGMQAGSNAEEIAFAFAFVTVLAAVVPWGYVWREYVAFPRAA